MYGHGEPWVGGELHLDDVDVDGADVGVADGDLPDEGLLDVVAAPPLAEPLAFFLEGVDQLGEAFVAGVLAGSGAELAGGGGRCCQPTVLRAVVPLAK